MAGLRRGTACIVRAHTAPWHKDLGFEGLRFACRLEGGFVQASIDVFVFLVTGFTC